MMYRPVLRLVAPPLIWFLHFGISYGSLSLLCNSGVPGAHSYLVAVATLATASTLGVLAAKKPEGASRFLDLGGVALAILCLVAVVWTTFSAFILPVC